MTSPERSEHEVAMDRQVLHEVGQVVRALEANGPQTEEELAMLVGAPYWEKNRFHRALTRLLSDGIVARDARGLIWTA
jgi:predicted transcriptional regulator